MHYLLILWGPDLNIDSVIRTLRATKLPVDKSLVEKHGWCSCIEWSLPVIREIRFFEVDVLDPCVPAFERLLGRLGVTGARHTWFSRYAINKLLKLYFPDRDSKMEEFEPPILAHRYHQRHMVLFKAPDRLNDKGEYIKCPNCGGLIPRDWL